MTVVHASLDPHQVTVPAEAVERIGEPADVGDEPAIDLGKLFGIDVTHEVRRAIRIRPHAQAAARWLLVGERIAVRQLDQRSVTPLPRWLMTIGEKLPLLGLVEIDGRFAFALDVERIGDEGA